MSKWNWTCGSCPVEGGGASYNEAWHNMVDHNVAAGHTSAYGGHIFGTNDRFAGFISNAEIPGEDDKYVTPEQWHLDARWQRVLQRWSTKRS